MLFVLHSHQRSSFSASGTTAMPQLGLNASCVTLHASFENYSYIPGVCNFSTQRKSFHMPCKPLPLAGPMDATSCAEPSSETSSSCSPVRAKTVR